MYILNNLLWYVNCFFFNLVRKDVHNVTIPCSFSLYFFFPVFILCFRKFDIYFQYIFVIVIVDKKNHILQEILDTDKILTFNFFK